MSALISLKSLPLNAMKEPIMAEPRKKGRKKKKVNEKENNEEENQISNCKICKGNHKTENCSIYNYYIWRRENPIYPKNKSKCKICFSRGHNFQTCDVRRGGMLGVNDYEIFQYYGEAKPHSINELINNKMNHE